MPDFSFHNRLCTVNKKGKMLKKDFWISDNLSWIDNIVYTKRRGSLSVLFLTKLGKSYSENPLSICVFKHQFGLENEQLEKWILNTCFFE